LASKRDQIKMSSEEVASFLSGQRVMNVAALGRDGWPHLTALWFVMRDGEPWIYTYAKSQKVRNLERDPRATLLVEAGHDYNELRGVMFRARAEVHHDLDTVAAMAEALFAKYQDAEGTIDDATRAALRAQAAKRAAVRFEVVETVTWDHSKLGGAY
jgi:PPOX class probable F420-dependent enzyme